MDGQADCLAVFHWKEKWEMVLRVTECKDESN